MRPAILRFFKHSCIYLRIQIISYLATFLGTNCLSVLMCRKAVSQSIDQSINQSTYSSIASSRCMLSSTTCGWGQPLDRSRMSQIAGRYMRMRHYIVYIYIYTVNDSTKRAHTFAEVPAILKPIHWVKRRWNHSYQESQFCRGPLVAACGLRVSGQTDRKSLRNRSLASMCCYISAAAETLGALG